MFIKFEKTEKTEKNEKTEKVDIMWWLFIVLREILRDYQGRELHSTWLQCKHAIFHVQPWSHLLIIKISIFWPKISLKKPQNVKTEVIGQNFFNALYVPVGKIGTTIQKICVDVRGRGQFIQHLLSYWTQKRLARSGVPLQNFLKKNGGFLLISLIFYRFSEIFNFFWIFCIPKTSKQNRQPRQEQWSGGESELRGVTWTIAILENTATGFGTSQIIDRACSVSVTLDKNMKKRQISTILGNIQLSLIF